MNQGIEKQKPIDVGSNVWNRTGEKLTLTQASGKCLLSKPLNLLCQFQADNKKRDIKKLNQPDTGRGALIKSL